MLTGIAVGFTTGLLGIGGGFIIVPILFYLMITMGYDPTLAIRVAFGTSLAVIIPTAISSVYGHYRKGEVEFNAALFLGISGFIGGIMGGYIATHVPGGFLRIIFAIILFSVALRMLYFKEPENYGEKKEDIVLFLIMGFIAGIASGLVGIGGGIILIPIMVLFLGFSMIEAGGTSSAVIVLTSLGGMLSYILNGLQVSGLPLYSLGYVNLLQLVVIVLISIPLAQIGAWASHKLPEKYLSYILAFIMIFISLRMLGIFEWLKLPYLNL